MTQQHSDSSNPAPAGQLAVITGGAAGIGRFLGQHFATRGWDIAFCDIAPAADDTLAAIEALGRRAMYQPCDVGEAEQVEAFYSTLEQTFGTGPDLVVNNAGCQTWAPLLELDEADWDRVIGTNLKGTFLNTQRAARSMIEHAAGGSIVNIGSGCNQRAFPKLVDCSASKGGVEMFTKSAAIELGKHGIRVNCVAPGGILIERTRVEAPDYAASWANITPLDRVGYPRDIADAVEFFASRKSCFVTGQTLFVDGGVFAQANWPYRDDESKAS
ncbi:MAG: SDR family NAD(P)-dependent oxidoreductase [Pseudomonadota bacterium]